jgi:hypothetical protein
MLTSLRISVSTAPLVLPVLQEFGIQLGHNFGRPDAARVIHDANAGADPRTGFLLSYELTRHPTYQPKTLELVWAGDLSRPCHEFVAPFVAPRNASRVG